MHKKREYFECDCGAFDHLLCIERENISDNMPELGDMFTIYLTMNPYLPWYTRILVAIKYLFNRDFGYAYHDMVIKEDIFREKIDRLLKND